MGNLYKTMEEAGECYCFPICDYCQHYVDAGTGPGKRNKFAGIGKCTVSDDEVLASDFCDDFICAICEQPKEKEK